jgi:hypothetical protein
MIVLNTAVAEALIDFKKRVDTLIEKEKPRSAPSSKFVREDIKTCKPSVSTAMDTAMNGKKRQQSADLTAKRVVRRSLTVTLTTQA